MVVTDGAAGNERQALALAAAMGLSPRNEHVRLALPWSWLAPHLRAGAWRALPAALREAARRDPPRLAIGCGRAGALASAALRRATGCFAVQILDPRAAPGHWDVVVAPAHDGLRGAGVVTTLGALNCVTPGLLATAAAAHSRLAHLPAPRTALLIGGSRGSQRIDAESLRTLLHRLARWHAREGGSFLVTTSRRTGADVVPVLEAFLQRHPGELWSGAGKGANPYHAYLAHADRIVVTADSVNLASEACATGKPVYVFAPRTVRGKLACFHRALEAGGHARPLPDELPPAWTPVPLRETAGVAAEIWRRYRGPAS